MSMLLVMSALGALALTSGISLIAVQPEAAGDEALDFQRQTDRNDIRAAGHEQAYAAMRGHFERA